MPNIFTRFPVASVQGVIVPILIAVTPLIVHNENAAGAVNVALMALGGVVAALGVSVDAGLPLLTGAAKAVIAAVLAFGVDIPETWQAAGLAVLSILVASWTHTQVTATQPANTSVLAPSGVPSVVRR
jgi:hypothetical protein